MKKSAFLAVILAGLLCSCGKQLQNTQAPEATPAPGANAAPQPQVLQFPDKVSVVRAVYGPQGGESDVTAQVAAILISGQSTVKADGNVFGITSAPGQVNTLTILFSGATGNFEVSANDGQVITIPSTTTVVRNPRLASDGTYFLLRYTSVTTDDGVLGFNPGTKFKLVQNNGSTIRVTDGHDTIDVPSNALTNDLDVAEAAYAQDAAAMATLKEWMAEQKSAEQAREAADAEAARSAAPQQVRRYVVTTPPAPSDPNPLDKGAYHQQSAFPAGF